MKLQLKNALKRIVRHIGNTRSSVHPLITVTISRSALLYNLNEFRRLAPEGQVAPVLKSNAYGHGQSLVAEILEKERVPFFVIDSYFEAQSLRNSGIRTPLLIVGYSTPESILKNNLKDVSFTITNLDTLRELVSSSTASKKPIKIHLKIDTGMHRQGILPEEKAVAIELIKKASDINLEGITSHLADADNTESTAYTEGQISVWNEMVNYFCSQFPTLKYWHISASAGHIFKKANANLTRLGIGLYGLINIVGLNIKPVLEMKTIISGVKKIRKGDHVGYGGTFVAPINMTIATIPVGYYEGVDRRLSNKGVVIISGTVCPIVGRVSMNITTVDVSSLATAKIGDEVTVISSKKADRNSVENIAKDCGIISYETAVYVPSQLKRVVVD